MSDFEAIAKAIEASRGRQRALEKKWPSSYSDALETEATCFREALAEAVEQRDEALTMVLDSKYAAAFRTKWNARIAAILAGEKS